MRARLIGLLVIPLLIVTLAGAPASSAKMKGLERRVMPAAPDGTWPAREYLVYAPERLARAPQRALVVYLHGCAQFADEAMKAAPWNALADQRGFVVVYPEQHQAGTMGDGNRGDQCWNWGQPLAELFPRGTGELETIARITSSVAAEFKVDPGRVFVAGLSSGAMMASAMAARYPDLYAATGSVVGCGYPCGDVTGEGARMAMGSYAQRMPAFLVSGTADYLTNPAMAEAGVQQWVATNDLLDDGKRGSVAKESETTSEVQPVEPAAEHCTENWNNPCPADTLGWSRYPTTVTRYADARGVVVESWVIHGLSHNYPGGNDDPDQTADGTFSDPNGPDVTTPMYEFFLAHAR